MITLLEWSTFEHHHTPKNRDWYFAVGIIALTSIILALMFGNVIFAIFLLLSAVALCIHATKPPAVIKCEVVNHGIIIQDRLFPYTEINSFWVEAIYGAPKLILKSNKMFMPYIIVLLNDVEPEDVRHMLLAYIKEEEHHEPLGHRLMEYLGF